ncbi:MAG TPA: accessory regulator AgrB [Clostridium sp.]|nr:accessory regulator AgrB [Clostridium sp.]
MKVIDNICDNITNYLAKELNLNKEKSEVIKYGMFSISQMVINIISIIIFGIIFNVVTEALIISFAISILRKSSGGVHASSPEKCLIIGTGFSIFIALILKRININFTYTCFLIIIIFLWAYYFIYKLAPVDSENKPIKSMKKKLRLKKSSITILSIYLLIIIFCLMVFIFTKKTEALRYILCICSGVVWQVFSLTKAGHIIFNIFN